jgi:hypothetical protein
MPHPGPHARHDEGPAEFFEMKANFEGLIQLLARNLYPDPDVFVRELIQNGHDSIRRRQEHEAAHVGRIDVHVRPKESTIVFRDDGIGMDREDIIEFLSVIGSTGTGTARRALEDVDSERAFELIGQFGIGMLSAFVVAERVTVRTRKLGSDEAFEWENQGRTECRLSPAHRDEPGTDIVVSVGREHAYILGGSHIRDAIVRYCDFLPVRVFLDDEGPVNAVHAPWDHPGRQTVEQRDSTYRSFLMRRYRDVPLEVIPVEIEEPVRARGALYISDRRLPDLNTAGVVDLFVRRMFVRGSDAELLPEWAKFIRGIIECPDLQPTAARDNVRRSGWAYTALRQRLSELIVSRLAFLATDRPERFKQINRWHHYHLKGMAVFHQDFFEQVGGLLLFDTNRGLMSLAGVFGDVEAVDEATEEEPWRASVPQWQGSDGDASRSPRSGPVLYFTQSRAATQFYRLADARGWTVVNAGRAFERELLVRYASSHGAAHRLVPLDAAHGQALFAPPSTAARDRIRELERDIEAALRSDGLDNVAVHVCRFAPASLPAIVLLSPDSEAELTLEDLVRQPWFAESLGDVTREVLSQRERRPLHLRLNEENDLVRRLLDAGPSLDGSEDVYWGLFLSAALNAQDLLTETTTTTLHRQLLRLLGSAVDSRRLARTERALDGGDES